MCRYITQHFSRWTVFEKKNEFLEERETSFIKNVSSHEEINTEILCVYVSHDTVTLQCVTAVAHAPATHTLPPPPPSPYWLLHSQTLTFAKHRYGECVVFLLCGEWFFVCILCGFFVVWRVVFCCILCGFLWCILCGFLYCILCGYECAKRTKFLLTVIYGSSRRHSNSSKNSEKNWIQFYDNFRTSWILWNASFKLLFPLNSFSLSLRYAFHKLNPEL